jgi:hypothetical protein
VAAIELAGLGNLSAAPGDAAGVLSVVAQIAAAPDTASAVQLLHDAAARLSADGAMFTSFVRDDATLASYRFLLACDPVWGLQYAKNNWCLDDPWLRYALYNTEPVAAETLPPANERAQWVTEAASHFGFASTLVVPAPTAAAQSRVGVLCLGSARQGFFAGEGGAAVRCLARSLAMELGDWMHRQIRLELMTRARISDDDLMLLRHEQQGHSSKAIAAELHLEPKTVDCRFHRLSLKLGTANRRAAVRLAEIYGLI